MMTAEILLLLVQLNAEKKLQEQDFGLQILPKLKVNLNLSKIQRERKKPVGPT